MAQRLRFIPPDIKEDVKLGKLIPISSLPWIIVSLLGSIILAMMVKNPFLAVLIVLSVLVITLGIVVLEAPKIMKRRKKFKKARRTVKDLKQLSNIEEYGAICKYKDKSEAVFLEYEVDPWEICSTDKQDKRADEFTQNIFSILKAGGEVSVYRICTAEDTSSLERRHARLNDLPEGSRELEDARIEHHYKESKKAKKTRHIIRIKNKLDNEESIQDILGPFEGNESTYLGEEAIKHLEEWQLTPSAKLERGTKEMTPKITFLEKVSGQFSKFTLMRGGRKKHDSK